MLIWFSGWMLLLLVGGGDSVVLVLRCCVGDVEMVVMVGYIKFLIEIGKMLWLYVFEVYK